MRKYLYTDEAGNFDFSGNPGASRYFILTTVLVADHRVELALLDLRRELAWEGVKLPREFHATDDSQLVRDRVFEVVNGFAFRIDATILEKKKASPRIRITDENFYRYTWFYHARYVCPKVASASDELLVIAASIGTRRRLDNFRYGITNVMNQTATTHEVQVDTWASAVSPCRQVADYCCWAIQRKWERGDLRSYDPIKDRISSEFELFAGESSIYY